MKNEKGITILSLILTVILLSIIVMVGIQYGANSWQGAQLRAFSYELEQIQGKVDVAHEQIIAQETEEKDFTIINGKTVGQNVTDSEEACEALKDAVGIDYDSVQKNDENYYQGEQTLYRYVTKSQLESTFNMSNMSLDVIINLKTREVISVKAQEYEGAKYYRLSDI